MGRRSTNPLTPEQRKLRSAIANAARWSRIPPSQRAAHTQAARDGITAKYLRLVDPGKLLPDAERVELARQAHKADLARAARKASRAASARRAARAREAGTAGDGDGAAEAVS